MRAHWMTDDCFTQDQIDNCGTGDCYTGKTVCDHINPFGRMACAHQRCDWAEPPGQPWASDLVRMARLHVHHHQEHSNVAIEGPCDFGGEDVVEPDANTIICPHKGCLWFSVSKEQSDRRDEYKKHHDACHGKVEPVLMWEVLVPTQHSDDARPIKTRHHRVWDAKVRDITGGLTITPPVKGVWVSRTGEEFRERMIPVRILATKAQIETICKMTRSYYRKQAVLAYCIGFDVIMEEG